MRSKVGNERISSPGVAASLEQLISPVDRLTSFEAVEIRDDLVAVALQFPWPRSGFHGNAVQLIDHVTSRFPTS